MTALIHILYPQFHHLKLPGNYPYTGSALDCKICINPVSPSV